MEEVEKKAAAERPGIGHTVVNIIGAVLCIIFIPIIILNLLLIVKSFTDKNHVPMVFGLAPVIVLSDSMYPTFEAGDVILIQKTDPALLKEGDVICFLVDGMGDDAGERTAITHTIVGVQQQDGENVFVTKGDANNIEDRVVVTQEQVQGEFHGFVVPGLGNVAVFLQSPLGMVAFIVAPLLLFFLWDLARRAVSARKVGKEKENLRDELERLRAQVNAQQAEKAEPEEENQP